MSPPNCNVKMSPHERRDIRVESEGTATSERDFQLRCEKTQRNWAAKLLSFSSRRVKRLKKIPFLRATPDLFILNEDGIRMGFAQTSCEAGVPTRLADRSAAILAFDPF
jgi:hypothetical protein